MNNSNNHYEGPAKFKKAALELCEVVRKASGSDKDTEISVYAFNLLSAGFRIAEISFVKRGPTGGAGRSYMRSDCPDILIPAEDFVLYSVHNFQDAKMFRAEAVDRMKYLFQRK